VKEIESQIVSAICDYRSTQVRPACLIRCNRLQQQKSLGSDLIGVTMKRFGCVFALSLCFVRPLLAEPPLPSYGIDINQTSVSGVSSGGAMAIQMHVAHSSIMRGVGVIAGVAYGCADPRLAVGFRLIRGVKCLGGDVLFGGSAGADFSRDRTAEAAGAIDDPETFLPRQKVWLFSGYNDGSVKRGAMDAVAKYYDKYVNHGNLNSGNIFYQIDNRAPHALITNDYKKPCLGVNDEHINDCDYDAARHLLEHIYGYLSPPSSNGLSGSVLAFDQSAFVANGNPQSIGLADTGYVYVPQTCSATTRCRVHVVFHGCKQYAGIVGRAVVDHGGYNEWADTNKLVVLYPQTVPSGAFDVSNPNGCWDWWGFTKPLMLNSDFARKTGDQISTIKKMLDRLAEGFVAGGGSSDAFGRPQNFAVGDITSTSVELIWQANTAAAGFNVYRSTSSTGPFTKRNIGLVSGASFADWNLNANSTYYYQISAIDGSNYESSPTDPVPVTTGVEPPPCNPHFRSNLSHLTKDDEPLPSNAVTYCP